MFILTTISDLVQIKPADLGNPSIVSIEHNLNEKYSNKIIQKVGLGICFYDLLKASDGLIGHDTIGTVNVNVVFRLVVFRPFKGEILCGKISSAWEDGMKIRLDFFEEIFIPSTMLFENSYFDKAQQTWIWPEGDRLFHFDKHEWVRFRVVGETWHDLAPSEPSRRGEKVPAKDRKSPYYITGSMAESFLGVPSWWEGDEELVEDGQDG